MIARALVAFTLMVSALLIPASTSPSPALVAAASEADPCITASPVTGQKIVAMGDSITTPYGASVPGRSWPVMLKTQAATHGWSVGLCGIGSTMAEQYLPGGPLFARTETVRNAHPDLVLMDWRANEQLQGRTPEQLKTSLVALIDQIRQVSPETQIMIINPPLMWYHEFVSEQTQDTFTAKMRQAAQERGAHWLDLKPFFPKTGPDAYSRQYLFDDIHPSDTGHAVFFAAIYTALLKTCLS